MGKLRTYKCNICGYRVMTSGGTDCGYFAVTDTYICQSCKQIVDVPVGLYGETYSKEEIPDKKISSEITFQFYTCPECGFDTNLMKWDNRKRPCPKCKGKMVIDAHGESVLWD